MDSPNRSPEDNTKGDNQDNENHELSRFQATPTENKNADKKYDYKEHDFKPKKPKGDDRNFIIRQYDKNYKKLLIIPVIIVIASVLVLLLSFSRTGEFFQKDVSIKGGVTFTILTDYNNLIELGDFLSEKAKTTVTIRQLADSKSAGGIIIDAGVETDEEIAILLEALEEKLGPLSKDKYSVQVIGSALGASFFKAVIVSILAAFVLMAVVVFIFFRFSTGKWILVPSLFIIWTVFIDMICTFAVLSLLQVKVSTAGLAAFLLLIGYSVDTDILLTMRVLKSKQEVLFERILTAARTGIFMTCSAIAAITAGLLVSQSDLIRQIMLILVIGLVFDLIHTWLTNTAILRWYLERNRYGAK